METKFSWQLMHIMSSSFKLIIPPLPSNLIDKKFDEITQLKSGWHFGEGETPSEEIIKIARKVLEIGMGRILVQETYQEGCTPRTCQYGIFE
ncbi:MAG: hypothetical protein GWP10_04470 [Nitrospiraceae bacterium]|nr:hypothetical protein [Nitrospiraceae bacterium]